MIQRARVSRTDLCLLSIDFSNAFGSIPHHAVVAALKGAGAGGKFSDLVADIYNGGSSSLLTSEGLSEPVPILSGVKQGCPLSGTLFNIAIDPLLRGVQGDADTYKVLAFADDILLLGDCPADVQFACDKLCNMAAEIGLAVNPSKSFSMHLGTNPVGCRDTVFSVCGNPVTALLDHDPAPFLGKPIGFNISPPLDSMEAFISLADSIMTSNLAPWQRVDAMKSFFYPSLSYAMRTGQFGKSEWSKLDDHLRPLYKQTLSLPPQAANEYLYGSSDKGLFGIPLSAEDSDIQHIDNAFKLLTSADPKIQKLAWDDLIRCVEYRLKAAPSPCDLDAYLSGNPLGGTNPISSVWTRARIASTRLGVRWSFCEDRTIAVLYGGQSITDRRKICKSLRACLRNERANGLRAHRQQGKTFPCFSSSKASSHFHRNGDFLRFTDWRFVHKARLSLVNLNAYRHSNAPHSRMCRRCPYPDETLPHVLCHCKRYMQLITDRHNRVVDRIRDAALGRWYLYSENRPVGRSALRPDLVLTKGNEALILDITVPFENGHDAFIKARKVKEEKYAPLIDELKGRFGTVKVEAIVVGALGSWDSRNDRVVGRLCSRKYAKLMRRLIVSDTIRASRNIYVEHLTDVKQTDGRSRYGRKTLINPSPHVNTLHSVDPSISDEVPVSMHQLPVPMESETTAVPAEGSSDGGRPASEVSRTVSLLEEIFKVDIKDVHVPTLSEEELIEDLSLDTGGNEDATVSEVPSNRRNRRVTFQEDVVCIAFEETGPVGNQAENNK